MKELEQTSLPQGVDQIKVDTDEARKNIEERFREYAGTPFRIYDDEVSLVNNGSEGKAEGYPGYYGFLKDCENLAQFAFLHEADTIVFFDKSARGYGLLTAKILTIVALDRAIREGISPKDIKLPKIEFLRLHRMGPINNFDKASQKFAERINSGERIVFFDESSQGTRAPFLHVVISKEKINWNKRKLEGVYTAGGGFGRFDIHRSSMDKFCAGIVSVLEPNKKNDFWGLIGSTENAGGHDYSSRRIREFGPYKIDRDYNISEPELTDNIDDNRLFYAKRGNSTPNEELSEYRQQLRDEHSRMAWELYREKILGENLNCSEEELSKLKKERK